MLSILYRAIVTVLKIRNSTLLPSFRRYHVHGSKKRETEEVRGEDRTQTFFISPSYFVRTSDKQAKRFAFPSRPVSFLKVRAQASLHGRRINP
jgi:hypothetical protein